MRKQYYFRASNRGLLAWDVDRLVRLSAHLPPKPVRLSAIREFDEAWDQGHPITWRMVVEHMQLIGEADLSFPIILSADGSVMDGRHRIAKAALQKQENIQAVQFERDPEPDYVGRGPDDLPY